MTPADFFLEKEKGRLSDTEKALIAAISHAPFSFHEVIRASPAGDFC